MNLSDDLARDLACNRINRRQALWLLGAGSVGATLALQGCGISPVTGKSILVGMSEAQERAIDAELSPHQFSQDLGAVQDAGVNAYVAGIGRGLDKRSHRPGMPYSYRVLNANYINAYTFPGGAVGVTRGILAELNDEAELAALLGHELGHVNARHAAQRQGQSLLAQAVIAGVSIAAQDNEWGAIAGLGSQIGASALLSSYSRDNEREADALGQDYMVKAGYPAGGMTELHQLLVNQEKSAPGMLETMFSSHPMSVERRDSARHAAATRYAASAKASPQRERFMDSTAAIRRIKPTINDCKRGETAMSAKDYAKAQTHFRSAVRRSNTRTPRSASTRRKPRRTSSPACWRCRCAIQGGPTRPSMPSTAACRATPAWCFSKEWRWKVWANASVPRASTTATCSSPSRAAPRSTHTRGSRRGAICASHHLQPELGARVQQPADHVVGKTAAHYQLPAFPGWAAQCHGGLGEYRSDCLAGRKALCMHVVRGRFHQHLARLLSAQAQQRLPGADVHQRVMSILRVQRRTQSQFGGVRLTFGDDDQPLVG